MALDMVSWENLHQLDTVVTAASRCRSQGNVQLSHPAEKTQASVTSEGCMQINSHIIAR